MTCLFGYFLQGNWLFSTLRLPHFPPLPREANPLHTATHPVIEDGPWEVRYLVIDTRNWLPGKLVLIPPLWAEDIDWETRRVEISLTREMIQNSPEFDPDTPVNRQYEEVFYDYYGRPKYWTGAGHAVR